MSVDDVFGQEKRKLHLGRVFTIPFAYSISFTRGIKLQIRHS
jgi:hypothetical protein